MNENDQQPSKNQSPIPRERRRLISEMIRKAGSVTVAELEAEFGISSMTARRDLAQLEGSGQVERTHGGAVLSGLAGHEDSFQHRMKVAVPLKERLALAALSLLEPEEAVFMDSSTTAHFAARRILNDGLRVTLLTNLVPTMELFSSRELPNVRLVGFGGDLRQLTLSFVGPQTTRAIRNHFADKAFISVKGVTSEGYLTDPDPLEAEVKQTMIGQSRDPVLLVDANKFERRGLHVVGHISDFERVLVADLPSQHLEGLAERGVEVTSV